MAERWQSGLLRWPYKPVGPIPSAIEYALIASSISIVILGAANGVGATVSSRYSTVASSLR